MSTMEELPLEQHGDMMTGRRTVLRREYVVARVHAADDPVAERELAMGFVATRSNEPSPAKDVHVTLRHRDLPKLDAAGLVSWDQAERTVAAPADAPEKTEALDGTATLVEDLDGDDADEMTDRQRRIVDALDAEEEPVDASALAREVATDGGEEPSEDDVESALVQLHHVDLPKLDDDGLVEYDAADRTVAPRTA